MSSAPSPTSSRPPGPRGEPVLGNFRAYRRDPFRLLLEGTREFGPVTRYALGPIPVFLVTDPDHVKQVLVDKAAIYPKAIFFQRLKVLVGDGLLTSEGELWKRQRRMSNPSFHRDAIAGFAATIADVTRSELDQWEPLARRGQAIDFDAALMALTLRLIGRTIFGMDLAAEAAALLPVITQALTLTDRRVFGLLPMPMWLPTPRNLALRRATSAIDALVYRVIAARRREPRADLVSTLLAARDEETGEAMGDRQLRDEIITLILAGHETTGCALGWTFHLLGQHPDAEASAVAEAAAAPADPLALARTPYITQVVQESMRLFPPGWVFSRQAAARDEIGGFEVAPGTQIFLSPFVTHRLAHLWPDPDTFKPERFTEPGVAGRPRFAYFPFGGGQHLCIGSSLARMELGIAIPMILQRFEVKMAPGSKVTPRATITLRPTGLRARLTVR
jgi:cytochrome P450